MERLLERCAGLDVHKRTVAACVRVPGPGGKRVHHVHTFGTTAADLLALGDWLATEQVSHVAMETAPRGAWLQRSNGRKGGDQAPVDPGMAPTTPEASPAGRGPRGRTCPEPGGRSGEGPYLICARRPPA